MAITVTTKDGKLHPYPTATVCVPAEGLGITGVYRPLGDSAELVAWFPTVEVAKVEYFLRTEVAVAAPDVDGMPVN